MFIFTKFIEWTILIVIWLFIVSLEFGLIRCRRLSGRIAEINFTAEKISAINIDGEYLNVLSLANRKLRKIIKTHTFGAGDIISISFIHIPKLKIGLVYNVKHIAINEFI